MFIGHFGAGFAGKKIDQRPSLGTMFMAAQWLDLVWPVMLLLGIEKVRIDPGNTAMTPLNFVYYPYTHGLLAVIIWAFLFGGIYYVVKKNCRGAILLGSLVISHWIFDLIVHRPDLTIMPGINLKVGFGLWNSKVLSVLVESLIFFAGAFLYFRTTNARNKKGNIGFWSLLVFFVLVYIMNLIGPPPQSVKPIAFVGLAQWLFVIWAYWLDRNRQPRNTNLKQQITSNAGEV